MPRKPQPPMKQRPPMKIQKKLRGYFPFAFIPDGTIQTGPPPKKSHHKGKYPAPKPKPKSTKKSHHKGKYPARKAAITDLMKEWYKPKTKRNQTLEIVLY